MENKSLVTRHPSPVTRHPSPVTRHSSLFTLLILTFLIYLNSLPNDFIFDDIPLVQNSLNVMEMGFWDLLRSYRPLRYISYALDYRIFGMNPWGFRLMNIFYHSLTVIAVFWMLKVFGLTKKAAFISALLFAIHPVNTDSVAYISGRRDIIMGLFYVLSIGMFMKFYNGVRQSRVENDQRSPLHAVADCTTPSTGEQSSPTSTGRHTGLPLLFSLLFMFLSISSKEMGATIPLVYILYIFYKDGSKLLTKRWFYIVMMLFLLLFSFFAFTAISGGGSGLVSLDGVHYHGNSPQVHYLTATTIWLHYLKQALLPFWLILDNANFPLILDWNFKVFFSILSMFVYGGIIWKMVTHSNVGVDPCLPGVALAKTGVNPGKGEKSFAPTQLHPSTGEHMGSPLHAVADCTTPSTGEQSSPAFFLVFFVIALAPVLQIIPLHEIVAEHYLYVPVIGFCAIFGMVSDLWLSGGGAASGERQSRVENDQRSCGSNKLPVENNSTGEQSSPTSTQSQTALHSTLTKKTALGLVFLVIIIFSAQTIRRNFQLKNHWTVFHADQKVAPLSFRGYFTLGAEYVGMKFPDKALEYYKKAFETGSWDGNLLSNMIGYYILKGDHRSAIDYYEEMIRRKEFITPNGVLNISVLYMINGNCDEAVRLATSFHPLTNQIKRIELVKQCEKHNFARFDNNSIEDIHEKQLLLKELGLEIERKPYLKRLLAQVASGERQSRVENDQRSCGKRPEVAWRAAELPVESGKAPWKATQGRVENNSTGEHQSSPRLRLAGTGSPLHAVADCTTPSTGEQSSPTSTQSQTALQIIRELAVVNLQSDIPEAIFYYKMERDLHIKKGNPVPPIVEQSIHALEYYQHQVLVEGKYIKLDW